MSPEYKIKCGQLPSGEDALITWTFEGRICIGSEAEVLVILDPMDLEVIYHAVNGTKNDS